MDRTPPELWHQIFSFACTDTGYTGRSLSLVSKYIHATSQPYKLQSISLCGVKMIMAFAALLTRIPPHFRRLRYLFVSTRNRNMSDIRSDIIWKQLQEGPTAVALEQILHDAAPSLEVLELNLEYHPAFDLNQITSFPHLTDLTSHGGYPIMLKLPQAPLITPCTSLRYLHVIFKHDHLHGSRYFNSISFFAPYLTHLRFSDVAQEVWFAEFLKVGLGLDVESIYTPLVKPLPTTIEQVVVRPMAYHTSFTCEIPDDRVSLLPPPADEQPGSLAPISERDWLDRISGGKGCWGKL